MKLNLRFLARKPTLFGLGIIVAMLVFVFLGPYFIHYQPLSRTGPPNSPPSVAHIFGTDYGGHDIASQVIYGAYPTLIVGLVAASVATLLGYFAGLFGGYYSRLQAPIYGITDVILCIPGLVLLVLIGSMFVSSDIFVTIALILILWPSVARAVRAQIASVKKMAYIEATKTSGFSDSDVLWRIVAPEVGSIAFAYFVFNVSIAIVIVTALEFLGVGNVGEVSWGSTLYFAQTYGFFTGDWWWVLAPGMMIALTSTAFALIGFSVEEIMNPRLRI